MDSTDTILEGDRPRSIWANFISFHPAILEKNIKDFQFFQSIRSYGNHLECTERSQDTILEVTNQGVSHPSLVQFWPHSRNNSSCRRSTWEKLTDDGCLMVGKAHMCLWLWWAKNKFWWIFNICLSYSTNICAWKWILFSFLVRK